MASLVLTRLDYCNATVVGLPSHLVDWLQSILNSASWVIAAQQYTTMWCCCYCGLHCLWTPQRSEYKLAMPVYRCLHGLAPSSTSPLCQPCSDTRLRSTSRGDFIVPWFNRQLSNSSFSAAAPSAWNRLPSHIRTSSTYTLFLTRLNTHLFAESLLWHCYAVVFSLYFWRPRALDVGRHSKFMLIDWLIDWLIVLTTRLAVEDRVFYVTAAWTWNSLTFGLTSTSSLSTFRRQLKTLLFTTSYTDSFHRTWHTVFVLCREFRLFVWLCQVSLQSFWHYAI